MHASLALGVLALDSEGDRFAVKDLREQRWDLLSDEPFAIVVRPSHPATLGLKPRRGDLLRKLGRDGGGSREPINRLLRQKTSWPFNEGGGVGLEPFDGKAKFVYVGVAFPHARQGFDRLPQFKSVPQGGDFGVKRCPLLRAQVINHSRTFASAPKGARKPKARLGLSDGRPIRAIGVLALTVAGSNDVAVLSPEIRRVQYGRQREIMPAIVARRLPEHL